MELLLPPPLIAPELPEGVALAPAGPVAPIHPHGLLLAHNQARRQAGRPELVAIGPLMYAAQDQAEWMHRAGVMAHDRPSGYSVADRMKDYRVAAPSGGENIAKGFADLDSLMAAWLSSPGHRANILGAWTHVGFGIMGVCQCVVFARLG